jgi:hypothetical protein
VHKGHKSHRGHKVRFGWLSVNRLASSMQELDYSHTTPTPHPQPHVQNKFELDPPNPSNPGQVRGPFILISTTCSPISNFLIPAVLSTHHLADRRYSSSHLSFFYLLRFSYPRTSRSIEVSFSNPKFRFKLNRLQNGRHVSISSLL